MKPQQHLFKRSRDISESIFERNACDDTQSETVK